MIGNIQSNRIDTTPGADHWAAPPSAVADYTAWLRERFRVDAGVRQYMVLAANAYAKRGLPLEISGPYADDARAAVLKLATSPQTPRKPDPQR